MTPERHSACGMQRVAPARMSRLVAACFALVMLAGCAGTYPEREVNYRPTDVMHPASELAEAELLGVRIHTFAPGKLPEDKELARGLSPEIRKAEGYYVAVKLKDTMQGSGHWGPVRVVPAEGEGGEVIVHGEILESDGEALRLKVDVKDSTGAEWFTREYGAVVNAEIYDQAKKVGIDPFQYLYNSIANDIAQHRQKLPSKQVATIREVAELKFAADIAPDAFKGYLKTEKQEKKDDGPGLFSSLATLVRGDDGARPEAPPPGPVTVARLPSRDDPMYARVNRLRARDHLLVDTLDQQYDVLARNIADAYTQWRTARLTEVNAIRERENLKQEQMGKAIAIGVLGALAGAAIGSRNCAGCASTGAVIAGAAVAIGVQQAVQASEQAEADTQIRKAALVELGQSLAGDVKPVVMEVEGQTVELKGSVEAKYKQWRGVLKQLYEREFGPIDNAPTKATPPAASQPTASGEKAAKAG